MWGRWCQRPEGESGEKALGLLESRLQVNWLTSALRQTSGRPSPRRGKLRLGISQGSEIKS